MLGIVLCGGQSSRMGSDKGLLEFNEKTWVRTATDKIDKLLLPFVISVNKNQHKEYSSFFSSRQLVADNDSLKLKGPLCGLLSVHIKFPGEDLLVLACDMPLIEPELLQELLSQYDQHASYDAFIYTNDSEPEPLCGVYKAKGLATIYNLYISNQLQKHSMKYMLEHISTFTIDLPGHKKNCFRNFNSHSEINGQ